MRKLKDREKVINEQLQSLETRHEEIQEAYLELQQNATELQRRVDQLTALHEAGLAFISTLIRILCSEFPWGPSSKNSPTIE